jgi:hypothetical protein
VCTRLRVYVVQPDLLASKRPLKTRGDEMSYIIHRNFAQLRKTNMRYSVVHPKEAILINFRYNEYVASMETQTNCKTSLLAVGVKLLCGISPCLTPQLRTMLLSTSTAPLPNMHSLDALINLPWFL